MSDRSLWVKIGANITGLQAGLAKAQQGVKDFDKSLQDSARRRQGLDELGSTFGKVGLAAAGGVAMVVKAAMDWETAWAGVTKTVEGTDAQLSSLEGQLREMARTMPATHAEIAAVAQAAGALGVETENVAEFTRTMVMLGEATDDLTADQAATSMQQFMNIMQTAPEDVDNLANTLVRLGNNGASTEGQILGMAQRIAGAGRVIGLAESEVFGIANAIASTGIDVEAGGTAVSKILIDMAKAASTGSPKLAKWASTTGVTVDEFKRLMDTDPAEAFRAMTDGLGRISDEGGDVFTLLKDLGQSDMRVSQALLGMAGSGDMLAGSLSDARDAMANGSDMTDEYAKRAETSAAKAKVAWNGIKDNLIDIGADALPAVKELAEAVSELTGWFSDLPPSVKGGALQLMALTAGLGGSVWAVSRVTTGFANLANTLSDVSGTGEKLTRGKLFARGAGLGAGLGLMAFSDQIGEVNKELGTFAEITGATLTGAAIAGPWGALAGIATSSLGAIIESSRNTREEIARLAPAFSDATGQMEIAKARQLAVAGLTEKSIVDGGSINALEGAKAIDIDLDVLTSAAMGSADALSAVRDRIDEIHSMDAGEFRAYADAMGLSVSELADIEAGLGDVLDKNADDWAKAGKNARLAAEATSGQIKTAEEFRVALEGVPPMVVSEIEALGYDVTAVQLDSLIRKYDLTPEQVQTVLAALDRASVPIDNVDSKLGDLDGSGARVWVKAETSQAREAISNLRGALAGLSGKNWIANVVARAAGVEEANGGVLDFYANGGLRENHVAQIAPAGAWRVWAEPETGGEAYIPLSQQKRQRSLEIWAETGKRLGVQGYANGSVSGGSATGPMPSQFGIRITNWATGEGRMTAIADDRSRRTVTSQSSYDAASRRQKGTR